MKRAAKLTRELMAKYHIPASRACRHYDVTHKQCPEPWVRKSTVVAEIQNHADRERG